MVSTRALGQVVSIHGQVLLSVEISHQKNGVSIVTFSYCKQLVLLITEGASTFNAIAKYATTSNGMVEKFYGFMQHHSWSFNLRSRLHFKFAAVLLSPLLLSLHQIVFFTTVLRRGHEVALESFAEVFSRIFRPKLRSEPHEITAGVKDMLARRWLGSEKCKNSALLPTLVTDQHSIKFRKFVSSRFCTLFDRAVATIESWASRGYMDFCKGCVSGHVFFQAVWKTCVYAEHHEELTEHQVDNGEPRFSVDNSAWMKILISEQDGKRLRTEPRDTRLRFHMAVSYTLALFKHESEASWSISGTQGIHAPWDPGGFKTGLGQAAFQAVENVMDWVIRWAHWTGRWKCSGHQHTKGRERKRRRHPTGQTVVIFFLWFLYQELSRSVLAFRT